jgi:hypothetical protein
LNTPTAEEPNAHHNRDGGQPFLRPLQQPNMFVDPFDARI